LQNLKKKPFAMKEKKYFPVTGAVNFPEGKFMAPPVLSTSTSNGIGVFVEL
jgi:hypothetical protein